MTMMTHAHSPHLLQDHSSSSTADVSNATSHLAMIKRFAKFALTLVLFVLALAGIMAIRFLVWMPPFHH
jgi:hypothetical protein